MYASFVWIRVSLWKGTEQKEEEKYGLVRIVSLIRFLHRVAIASLLEETENESRLFFSVQPVTPQSNVNRYTVLFCSSTSSHLIYIILNNFRLLQTTMIMSSAKELSECACSASVSHIGVPRRVVW